MGSKAVSWVLLVLLFAAALGLSLANTEMTELRFFGAGESPLLRAPLVVLLLGFFLCGVAAGLLARVPVAWRQRRRIRELERRLRAFQAGQMPEPGSPVTESPLPRLGR